MTLLEKYSSSSTSSSCSTVLQNGSEMAHILANLATLQDGARMILSCGTLPDAKFSEYFRKIIAMVEICKRTLEYGVDGPIYLFAYCPPKLAQEKDIYYELLRMLKARKHLVEDDPKLRVRLARLLLPLTTFLVIEGRNSASPYPRPLARLPQQDTGQSFRNTSPDDMEIIWSESSVPAIHGRLFARNHRRMHKVLEVPKDLIPYYGLRLMPDGEIVVQEPASSPYRLEVRPRRFGQLWNKSQMLYRNSTRHGAGRVGV